MPTLAICVSYQLLLPIPDLDAQYRHEAWVLFEAILARAMHDLRLDCHRDDTLAWFEGGECRRWCELLGLDIAPILARVEVELDKPALWRRVRA